MPSFIQMSGPYGIVLILVAMVILFLTVRSTVVILRGRSPGSTRDEERLNALLFWGGVAPLLGLLGQCDGAYRAHSSILNATEISPEVVAEGFVLS